MKTKFVFNEPVYDQTTQYTLCVINGWIKFSYCANKSITAFRITHKHPDDQFDSAVGKRIAESRASLMAFQQIRNKLKEDLKQLEQEKQQLFFDIERAEKCAQKEKEHLKNF